jgi:hypothetical protein
MNFFFFLFSFLFSNIFSKNPKLKLLILLLPGGLPTCGLCYVLVSNVMMGHQ